MEAQKNSRVEEFLDLYRQLEDALEEKYPKARRYASVVVEYVKDEESAPVRDRLETCRTVRNLLTHSANLEGQPVVEPSAPLVEALREALDFVRKPPLALNYATRGEQMMKAHLGQKALRVMEMMDKNGYSHIPVMAEGKFCGVFSTGAVFRYQLHTQGRGLGRETTLRDMQRFLTVGEQNSRYEFMPKTATYAEARRRFELIRGKNQRVSVIFITAHGRPGERLLGMLTPWDLLGEH